MSKHSLLGRTRDTRLKHRLLYRCVQVMRGQWEEMRVLRQQNEGMRSDIMEIKDMLLGAAGAEPLGPTYNMGALKPSLPALTNSSRRGLAAGRKKPLG